MRHSARRICGIAIALSAFSLVSSHAKEDAKSEKAVAPADAPATPSPQLSPEDVVNKQMQALTAAGPVDARIKRCYEFASPENRKFTGPIERFSTMVQSPAYRALINAKHFLVGRATTQGKEAFLLVTTVDAGGELTLFRFFLSKQDKAPYAGCWMTDGVVRVGTMKRREEPRPPQAESPTI